MSDEISAEGVLRGIWQFIKEIAGIIFSALKDSIHMAANAFNEAKRH